MSVAEQVSPSSLVCRDGADMTFSGILFQTHSCIVIGLS